MILLVKRCLIERLFCRYSSWLKSIIYRKTKWAVKAFCSSSPIIDEGVGEAAYDATVDWQ